MSTVDETELSTLRTRVGAAWNDRALLEDDDHRRAVRRTIALLDGGCVRVAEPPAEPGGEMLSMLVRLSLPGGDEHGGPLPHPVYGEQLSDR
ncbi:MAG: hypothetical protein KC731_34465, partial [Myxococcales bacterium]|nr:hypothetical protein [Myxococcales bacterium]